MFPEKVEPQSFSISTPVPFVGGWENMVFAARHLPNNQSVIYGGRIWRLSHMWPIASVSSPHVIVVSSGKKIAIICCYRFFIGLLGFGIKIVIRRQELSLLIICCSSQLAYYNGTGKGRFKKWVMEMEHLIINIHCSDSKQGELLRTCKFVTEQTRQRTGCKSSNFSQNTSNKNHIILEQNWEQWSFLADYLNSDHFNALIGAMKWLGEDYEIRIIGAREEE